MATWRVRPSTFASMSRAQGWGNPSLQHEGLKSTKSWRPTSTTLLEPGAPQTSKYSTPWSEVLAPKHAKSWRHFGTTTRLTRRRSSPRNSTSRLMKTSVQSSIQPITGKSPNTRGPLTWMLDWTEVFIKRDVEFRGEDLLRVKR